jgi:CheY-like chemotaxis protein
MLFVILSVGRDGQLLKQRSSALTAAGYAVASVTSRDEALERLFYGDYDLVLLCPSLGEDSWKLERAVHRFSPSIPVVTISTRVDQAQTWGTHVAGTSTDEIVGKVAEVLAAGPAKPLAKPFSLKSRRAHPYAAKRAM